MLQQLINRRLDSGIAAIFFLVFILPLLVIGFILSVDLTRYFRNSQRAQQILDEAALQGYQYLPYEEQARTAIKAYLSRYPQIGDNTEIVTSEDAILLSLSGKSPLTFASYFVPGAAITITATSQVRAAPLNAYIALDTSNYLAPPKIGATWGYDYEWPPSSFFRDDYRAYVGSNLINPRNATQQCFNPAFSALKTAAIHIYEFLSGFKLNALGVGFFPGGQLLDNVRPLLLNTTSLPQGGEAAYVPQRSGTLDIELLCSAAAERESSYFPYRFPNASSRIPGRWQPPSGAPTERVIRGSWRFNEDYQPFLSVPEVIWGAMVQNEMPRTDQVFSQLWSRLQPASFTSRGKLEGIANRLAIVLAGDVPWGYETTTAPDGTPRFDPKRFPDPVVQQQLATVLTQWKTFALDTNNAAYPFTLLWVILTHENGLQDVTELSKELQTYFNQWTVNSSGEALKNLKLEVLLAKNPEDLVKKVSGTVTVLGKTALVAR